MEYGQFFAGLVARPPLKARAHVDAIIARRGRTHISSSADQFRFDTLRSRYFSYAALWDHALRAREEDRPGPFQSGAPAAESASAHREFTVDRTEPPGSRVIYTATLTNVDRETDTLKDLYGWVMESRREAGDTVVTFDTFVDLLQDRVKQLRDGGDTEVVCQAAVKDGWVSLSVRGVRDNL